MTLSRSVPAGGAQAAALPFLRPGWHLWAARGKRGDRELAAGSVRQHGAGRWPEVPPPHTPRPCARPAALRTLRGPPRDRGLRGFPPCGPAWACAPCEYLWGGRTCPKRRRLRPCPPRLLLRTRAQTRGQTLLPWDGRDTEGWWPGPRPALRPRGPRGLRCTRGRLRRPRRPRHRDSPEVQTRGLHLTTCGCAAPRPPGADVSRSPAPPGAVRLRSQLPGAMPRAGAAPPGQLGAPEPPPRPGATSESRLGVAAERPARRGLSVHSSGPRRCRVSYPFQPKKTKTVFS